MLMRSKSLPIIALIAVLALSGTLLSNAAQQKAAVPKPQDKMVIGEEGIKQLLPLMDTDKNGMVSRQEFLKFMAAEFDRLDKEKSGQLNVKELTRTNLSASRYAGK